MARIVHAQTAEHYECIRMLFLQYAESLDSGEWFDLGQPVVAVGPEEIIELQRPPAGINVFYRLRVLP